MFEDNFDFKMVFVGLVLWYNLKGKKIVLILLLMIFINNNSLFNF